MRFGKVQETIDFLKEVVREFGDDDCLSMAGSLAYATLFSIAPLLVIVLVVAGLVVSPEQAYQALQDQFSTLIGADATRQITEMLVHVRSNHGATVVARILGTLGAVIGATGVMSQLQAALNRAWGVQPDPRRKGVGRFVVRRLLSFAMILAIAFLLLVSLVLTAILTLVARNAAELLPDGVSRLALQGVNGAVSFLVVTLLFAAIFKVMPEARVRWRDVAVGALVTSALFTLGKSLIGVYLGNSNVGTAFGAASSLAIVLVWVYWSSAILLLGAEFTQVWTRRYGPGIQPRDGAVRLGVEGPKPA